MKAVQFDHYGDPEVLQLCEVPDPTPGPDDVLVEVKATTVNRLDMFQRDGSRPVGNFPFTPGLEAVGVVLNDNAGFHKGEHVLTTSAQAAKGGGGCASKIAVPASLLARIPDGVSFEQAAAAGLAGLTAWASLFDVGQLKAGERVLIWAGSSGVGSMAIQFAKHFGAWVVTTASNSQKAEELRHLGADLVINYKQENVGQTIQNAMQGVNLVIELVGTSLGTSVEACAQEGRIVLVGNLGGQQATIDTQVTRLKKVHIIGAGAFHTTPQNEEKILQLIAEKAVTPIIAHTMPVAQAAEAHRIQAQGEHQGKIVLVHG